MKAVFQLTVIHRVGTFALSNTLQQSKQINTVNKEEILILRPIALTHALCIIFFLQAPLF